MPSTSTTQNIRVFAPQVNLIQDTSRLMVKLKTGEGYTISGLITAGDVIRWDPQTNSYVQSVSTDEINAEVLGVVESISSGEYTVICSGSIKYPTSRLTNITNGAGGGVDVLFLDEIVAGGLTGTIDTSSGYEKIVKPVIQVAPHASYNGIVMNYVGYKTGNRAVIQEDTPVLPVGSIMYASANISVGLNWLNVLESSLVSVSDYSELYKLFTTLQGQYEETLNLFNWSGLNTGVVGKNFSARTTNGDIIDRGIITNIKNISGDSSSATITVLNISGSESLITDANYGYPINGFVTVGIAEYGGGLANNIGVTKFTVPRVDATYPVIGTEILVPYMKARDSISVKIPQTISLVGITATGQIHTSGNMSVNGTLQVGSLTNIESEILALKAAVFP